MVVVVRGIVRIIQKDDPGLIFVPFFLCLHYYTLSGRIRYNIHTWLCVCCLYKKTFLDMTWFDLVFFLFFKCRGYEDGDSLVHGVWLSIV